MKRTGPFLATAAVVLSVTGGTTLAAARPAPRVPVANPLTTTTTTAPPKRPPEDPRPSFPGHGPTHLACGPSSAGVVCRWDRLPPATARQVLMRDEPGSSAPVWESDDTGVRHHVDTTAEPGVTYAYWLAAFDSDGRFVGASNHVKVTAGATDKGAQS